MTESTRPRGGRTIIVAQAIALLLGLALLAWGANVLARIGAETLLVRGIQNATGVAEEPQVELKGPIFLGQVVRGTYDEVDVTVNGIRSGQLRIARVDATLLNVRLPFHDVLVRDVRAIGIGRSYQRVLLTYDDLNAYFVGTGRELTVSREEGGAVHLRGTVPVLNDTFDVDADVLLTTDEESIRITPLQLGPGSAGLSEATRLLLGQRLSLTIPLDTLPFGRTLRYVAATPEGIVVTAVSDAVVVRP